MKVNKQILKFSTLILVIIFIVTTNGCKEKEVSIELLPDVATQLTVNEIKGNTATGGGEVTNDKGETVTAKGVCWSTKVNPTKDSTTNDGKGVGAFTSKFKKMISNTTYYMRAYATNSRGTAYGSAVSFVTMKLATLETSAISNINLSKATGGGNIIDNGNYLIVSKGVCWSSTNKTPTVNDNYSYDNSNSNIFSCILNNLLPNTIYYERAFATTSSGTAYGSVMSFTTLKLLTISTGEISDIDITKAIGGGNIIDDGGQSILSRGICWSSTNAFPTINDLASNNVTGVNSFRCSLSKLAPNTTYYVRAYATSGSGTTYGNSINFVTLTEPKTVTDIDGNIYYTIKIGTQVWIVENLKTTKYNNGDPINKVTDNLTWSNLITGAYCAYNNDELKASKYGYLYNSYALTDSREIAPINWHLPTFDEWNILITYVNFHIGSSGSVAKALAANTDWNVSAISGAIGNNLSSNNSSGFSALPGGWRIYDGSFNNTYNCWWSSTSAINNRHVVMLQNSSIVMGGLNTNYNILICGVSVRCILD